MWRRWIESNQAAAADLLNTGSFNGQAKDACTQYINHFATATSPMIKPMSRVPKDTIDFMINLGVKLGSLKTGQVSYEDIVPAFARA